MGKRNDWRKADEDRKFLQQVGACEALSILEEMLRNHSKAPEWKRVVIYRRMKKLLNEEPVSN